MVQILDSVLGTVQELVENPNAIECILLTLSVGIFLVTFVIVVEPASHIFFDALRPRFKIQGYFMCLFESLIHKFINTIFHIEIEGLDSMDSTDFALTLSNHQGLLDYLVLIETSKLCGIDCSCFFFVWKHCVYLPGITTLFNWFRKNLDWRVPNISLTEIFAPILESPWRSDGGKWVTIFPEVVPYTASRAVKHRNQCQKHYCPMLDNLLYPRFNASIQAIDFFRDHGLNCVYDITILYKNNAVFDIPGLLDLLFSEEKYEIKIRVDRIPISAIPCKQKHLEKWLEKLWYSKDQTIKSLQTRTRATLTALEPENGQLRENSENKD